MSAEPAAPGDGETVDTLTRVLAKTCRELAQAGRAHRAGLLAADGWLALRERYPTQSRRLDGAMHHIARLEQEQERTRHDREETPMANEDFELDVRTEIPKTRHELINKTFAELGLGAAFVLVNDHDPKPLFYQFQAENPGEFSWEYLEEGPEVWRVRIGRVGAA